MFDGVVGAMVLGGLVGSTEIMDCALVTGTRERAGAVPIRLNAI